MNGERIMAMLPTFGATSSNNLDNGLIAEIGNRLFYVVFHKMYPFGVRSPWKEGSLPQFFVLMTGLLGKHDFSVKKFS